MKKFVAVCLSILISAVFVPNAVADEKELMDLIKQLQSQMSQMQNALNEQKDKIQQLESRPPQVQLTPPAPGSEAPLPAPMTDSEFNERLSTALGGADQWLKDLKFAGDLRLRYEAFDFSTGNPKQTPDRNRFRMRLRYGFEKTFNPDMKIGFGMITGEQDSGFHKEPGAGNQTFTNLFNYKNIWIEKAYATYTPHYLNLGPVQKVEVTAGKFNNPFEKGASDLIWDRDVKPEGVYEKIDARLLKTDALEFNLYATAGQFILQESSTLGKDAELFAYQGGITPVIHLPFLKKPVELLSAISYYDYDNFSYNSNFFIGGVVNASNGNLNVDGDPTTLDARNFNIIQSYSEIAVYPYGLPVRFLFDFARNTREAAVSPSVTGNDNAYALGVKLGRLQKKHDWEAGYTYKYLPANSTVGVFSDSDFAGGFVGHRGSVFKLGYSLTDSLVLNGMACFAENLNDGTAGIIDQQQRRFQVDLTWKF